MSIKLSRITLGVGPEPKWNKLFVKGEYARRDMPGGKIQIGTVEFREMITNWRAMGGNALPIDRFHWGDSNHTAVSADDKDAVGFIEDLRLDAEGDLEGLTNWNDLGREKLEKDRLRYFSPSFTPNAVNRHTGKKQGWTIHGGALLNDPFLSELPRLAASVQTPDIPSLPGVESMKPTLLAAISVALNHNFAADADEDMIEAAATKYAAARSVVDESKKAMAAELDKALKLSVGEKETTESLKKSLAVEVEARILLAKEVTKIQAQAKESAIDAMIDGLRRDRKIIAAEAADVKKIALAMGADECKRIYAARKPVVPAFGEVGVPGDADADVGETTPEQATEKLNLAAKEFEKGGMKPAEAFLAAIESNPRLALAAQPAPTRVAIVKQ